MSRPIEGIQAELANTREMLAQQQRRRDSAQLGIDLHRKRILELEAELAKTVGILGEGGLGRSGGSDADCG